MSFSENISIIHNGIIENYASLKEQRCEALAQHRLQPLIRTVEVFGFHLATVDLRQSSDQHEAVVAELLATARIEPDYSALPEDAKRALLAEKEPSMQFTTPEELGELAVFFCSPAGNNVRGVAWNMDGGWAAQ